MISLEEMFNKIGLYDTQTFVLFTPNGEKDGKDDLYVATEEGLSFFDFFFPKNGSIRTVCSACKQPNPFTFKCGVSSCSYVTTSQSECFPYVSLGATIATDPSDTNPLGLYFSLSEDECSISTDENGKKSGSISGTYDCYANGSPSLPDDKQKYKISKNEKTRFVINYLFFGGCDPHHIEEMSLLVEIYPPKICITKIGQDPDPSVLMDDLSGKYDSVLSSFGAKADFAKALKSHAAGLSAGSCCYMRRVLEKIIVKYSNDKGVDRSGMKTAEVIKKLSDLGVFVEDAKIMLSNLYSVLSVGIHKLSDDEINSYYETLSDAVVLTLQDELNKAELGKTRKGMNVDLYKIVSNISSKKH